MVTQTPQTQPLLQTLPLECPSAWQTESYLLTRQIKFFPSEMGPTISFSATRNSKILGYIPLVGTVIGINRIFKGFQEYQLFKNTHLHSLSNRSINWSIRGIIELIPILGGLICIVADIVATLISSNHPTLSNFPDETSCGYCHICGFCKC